MKVAVVGTRGIPDIMGGIETHCQELYPRLVERGASVVIFARKAYTPQKKPYFYKGVEVVPVYAPKISGVETFVHTFRCFLKVLAWKPDVVHLHAIGPSFIAPLFRLAGLNVALALLVHTQQGLSLIDVCLHFFEMALKLLLLVLEHQFTLLVALRRPVFVLLQLHHHPCL